jgi:hypothetical protein
LNDVRSNFQVFLVDDGLKSEEAYGVQLAEKVKKKRMLEQM